MTILRRPSTLFAGPGPWSDVFRLHCIGVQPSKLHVNHSRLNNMLAIMDAMYHRMYNITAIIKSKDDHGDPCTCKYTLEHSADSPTKTSDKYYII